MVLDQDEADAGSVMFVNRSKTLYRKHIKMWLHFFKSFRHIICLSSFCILVNNHSLCTVQLVNYYFFTDKIETINYLAFSKLLLLFLRKDCNILHTYPFRMRNETTDLFITSTCIL